MKKGKKNISVRMLVAIFIAQSCCFLCLSGLKNNLDKVSTQYRNNENKSYDALLYFQKVASELYEHEVCVLRYLMAEDGRVASTYVERAKEVRFSTESDLILCEIFFQNNNESESIKTFNKWKGEINAYLNCAEVAIHMKDSISTELTLYLFNDKIAFYLNAANADVEELRSIAESRRDQIKGEMDRTLAQARRSFFVGMVLCFAATVFCITYCKKIFDLQEEYRIKADEANKAKSQFLSSMSHEIRTPINAIIGFNEMISRESDDGSILAYTEKITTSSNNLLSLVNDILDFSKIEAGKMEIVPVEYDLNEIISEMWDMTSVRARGKSLCLDFKINPRIPSRLYGDAVRVRQLMVNLLTNAVKYTPEGTVTLELDFDNESDDSIRLNVAVKDTGIGINPTEIDKLTEAFERIDVKRNSTIEGTGLGLSIVGKILALMDSKLEVSSIYGEGSTFSFSIIQKVVSREGVGTFEPKIKEVVEKKKTGPLFVAPNAEILAVDDNDINRMIVKDLLKRTKVSVELAEGGKQAFEMAKVKKYDVILMDHRMPEIDGIQALHMIKEEGVNIDTPVIMVTANAEPELEELYRKEGFAASLRKPIVGEELEATLDQFLPDKLKETPPETGEGFDEEAGKRASGGDEMFQKIVEKFVESYEVSSKEINDYFENKDYENYTIKVHALKSTARLVGATELSEKAKHLEKCGDEKNIDEINEKTPELMKLYKEVVGNLKEKYCSAEEEEKEPIPKDELLMLLEAVAESTKAFDFDTVDSAVAEIEKYKLPDELAEDAKALKEAAFAMNCDELTRLAEKMKGGC